MRIELILKYVFVALSREVRGNSVCVCGLVRNLQKLQIEEGQGSSVPYSLEEDCFLQRNAEADVVFGRAQHAALLSMTEKPEIKVLKTTVLADL